jgi:hypothetical protein
MNQASTTAVDAEIGGKSNVAVRRTRIAGARGDGIILGGGAAQVERCSINGDFNRGIPPTVEENTVGVKTHTDAMV